MIRIQRPEEPGKKLFFVFSFLISSLVVITTSFLVLSQISPENTNEKLPEDTLSMFNNPQSGVSVFASLPSSTSSVNGQVLGADARVELIRRYLNNYSSPLEVYSEIIVSTADDFGIDFRLTTAIAQQESNLCKKIPPESNNCWGWGIHSRGTLGFPSYGDGIIAVTKGLKENYIDKGLFTVEDIMSKYTPLSSGSWAAGVNQFMGEIQ